MPSQIEGKLQKCAGLSREGSEEPEHGARWQPPDTAAHSEDDVLGCLGHSGVRQDSYPRPGDRAVG